MTWGLYFHVLFLTFILLKLLAMALPESVFSSAKISDVCVAKFTCFVRTRNLFLKLRILSND